MQESRLADAGIRITPSKSRRRQIENLVFAIFFLAIVLAIRFLTLILLLIRFRRILPIAHRFLGFRNRVLYLEAFFPENAGYHYRTQKWIEVLNENGFQARVRFVFTRGNFERMLKEARVKSFQSIFLLRRIWQCLAALFFNQVIVRRELLLYNDYGDLFLDKFLLALHPTVILDFDDDIAAAKGEPREITPFGRLMLENPAKFSDSLRLYSRFIVGTSYLKKLVLDMSPGVGDDDVVVIPTAVDYGKCSPKVYDRVGDYVNFGWIGSNNTMSYLDIVTPALNQIARRRKIRLIVVSGQDFAPEADFEVVNIPWALKTEIQDLLKIDIGLMPLYDTAAERGKCGFKLVQYMGLGIVSIASDVTVNSEIIDDKQNGFLVRNQSDWVDVMEEVLEGQKEFSKIGRAAREKINHCFSFESNKAKYLSFINARADSARRTPYSNRSKQPG